jgi:hypothetical protein
MGAEIHLFRRQIDQYLIVRIAVETPSRMTSWAKDRLLERRCAVLCVARSDQAAFESAAAVDGFQCD